MASSSNLAITTTTSVKRPLKILCLHGYCQNSQLFRRKSGSIRKTLERSVNAVRRSNELHQQYDDDDDEAFPLARFEYIEAPFILQDKLNSGNNSTIKNESDKYNSVCSPSTSISVASSSKDKVTIDRTKRSWWQAEDGGGVYHGWELSLRHICTAFQQNEYDGVLGFSQGAVIASLLCSLRDNEETPELKSLKFALLFSGAKSRAKAHQPLFENSIKVPSLHVMGMNDEMVPFVLSEKLSDCFDDSVTAKVQHTFQGGHLIPSDKISRSVVSNFVLNCYDDIFFDNQDKVKASL